MSTSILTENAWNKALKQRRDTRAAWLGVKHTIFQNNGTIEVIKDDEYVTSFMPVLRELAAGFNSASSTAAVIPAIHGSLVIRAVLGKTGAGSGG